MIFRFFRNDFHIFRKWKWIVKKGLPIDVWEIVWEILFLIFLKASPENISDFRHFIGILMIWETVWETGDDFCQKSIYSGKKIKSFFLVLKSFKTCKKRSPDWKVSPKCLLVNLNILKGDDNLFDPKYLKIWPEKTYTHLI